MPPVNVDNPPDVALFTLFVTTTERITLTEQPATTPMMITEIRRRLTAFDLKGSQA